MGPASSYTLSLNGCHSNFEVDIFSVLKVATNQTTTLY